LDALDGYLMVVVRSGDRPRFSVRLSDGLHLVRRSRRSGRGRGAPRAAGDGNRTGGSRPRC
jgi:hypothetical protein